MEDRHSNLSIFRAVVVSRDPLVGIRAERLCPQGWRAIRVASGYEAAAEILVSPITALLVDLRTMNHLHGRLLELAEQMKVRVFAIAGDGSAIAESRPIRPVAPEDLPGILDEVARQQVVDAPAVESPPAQPNPPAEAVSADPEIGREQPRLAPTGQRQVALTPKRPAARPRDLLTDSQLAKLLEEEQ